MFIPLNFYYFCLHIFPSPLSLFTNIIVSTQDILTPSYLVIVLGRLVDLCLEGQLNGVMEEADKEKALKQVAKASLKEKTLGLNMMEQRATTVEKALEFAEQKVEGI